MKPLLVTSIYPPEIGGLATYACEFGKRFPQTEIIALTDGKGKREGNVRFIPRKNKLLREARLFLRILRSSRGKSVIFSLNCGAVGLPAMLVAKLTRKRFVLRFAGDSAWEKAFRERKTEKTLEQFLTQPDANNNIIRLQQFLLRHADQIIVPSQYLAELLEKHYKVKSTVIPNAVTVEQFEPQNRLGDTILTVGRLVAYKRIHKIIDNLPKGVKLVVVGEGDDRQILERLAQGKDVFFIGSIDHNNLLKLMAQSDLLVLYSLYEGMSHILLEAMWVGLPVVATDYPANSELIENGVNGILVNNENQLKWAMETLMAEPEHRKALADRAKERVATHIWESVMSKTQEVLEKELK